jgi:flagellar hook-length control protein FliK
MDAPFPPFATVLVAGKPPQTITASVPSDGQFGGAFRSAGGDADEAGTPEDEDGPPPTPRLDAGARTIAATKPAWSAVPNSPLTETEGGAPEPVSSVLAIAAGALALPEGTVQDGTVARPNVIAQPAAERHVEGSVAASVPGRDAPTEAHPEPPDAAPSLPVPAGFGRPDASPFSGATPHVRTQPRPEAPAGGHRASTAVAAATNPGEDPRGVPAAATAKPAEGDAGPSALRLLLADAAPPRTAGPSTALPTTPEPLLADGGEPERTAVPELASRRGQAAPSSASPGSPPFPVLPRAAETVAATSIPVGALTIVDQDATVRVSRDLPAVPVPAAPDGQLPPQAVARQATDRQAAPPGFAGAVVQHAAASAEDGPEPSTHLRSALAGRTPAFPYKGISPAVTPGVSPPAAGPAPAGMAVVTRPKVVSPAGQGDAGAGAQPLVAASATDPAHVLHQPAQGGNAPGGAASGGSPVSLALGAAQAIVATLPSPLRDLGTGTLEIALDPPELGRVRLSLVETGGVMVVSILADRPETADLMRRHLDILAQEFARSGLEPPQVRIGAGSAEGGTARGGGERDAQGLEPTETALTSPPPPPPAGTGALRALDLRL